MKRIGFAPVVIVAGWAALGLATCRSATTNDRASQQGGAGGGQAAPATPQAAQAQAEEPRCAMSCSPDKPRTVVAEISWPLPQRAASREALNAGVSGQTLEVTTFKDGFETGAFVGLSGVQENQRFAARAAAPDVTTGASLQSLAVTRVATLADRLAAGGARSAARELMPPSAGNDADRVVVVEIEGLKPGLNYYWRRSAAGPVVRCQAPVCPYDEGRGGRR